MGEEDGVSPRHPNGQQRNQVYLPEGSGHWQENGQQKIPFLQQEPEAARVAHVRTAYGHRMGKN